MPIRNQSLPPEVVEAIRRGQIIEAIKLLRDAGLGLKEAKAAVSAQAAGKPASFSGPAERAGPLPPEVSAALQRGDRIEAASLLRKASGLGLKESMDWIDASQRQGSGQNPMLAPGEVPRSGGGVWWIGAAVVAGLLAYYLLR